MTRFATYLFLASIIFLSCNKAENTTSQNEQNLPSTEKCKLPRVIEGPIALGFPKVEGLAPSIGELNMAVLFVDFDDVPASKSVDSVFSIINPIAPDFFKEISFGKLSLNLNPHLEWIRLSESSEHYGKGIYKFMPHREFIQEAVDSADGKFDFSNTDIVLVLTNPEAKAVELGPTFKSLDPDYQIKAKNASISTAITSGYDLNYWGGIWLAHETGHTFGLPDLYHFGYDSLHRYVGTFGLMSDCAAKAPGYFAFERWNLGWLDDAQIYCHEKGEATIEIEAIEREGGTKAIIIPIDSTSALAVESRRKLGFDQKMIQEGPLVYLVNTGLSGGSGPIRVKPGGKIEYPSFDNAPLVEGEIYVYENIEIELLESKEFSDKIKVTVDDTN